MKSNDRPSSRMERLADKWWNVADEGTTRLYEALMARNAMDAQRYAIPAGIATDKLQLLLGRPTEIVGHLEDNRVAFAKVVKLFAELDAERPPPAVKAASHSVLRRETLS